MLVCVKCGSEFSDKQPCCPSCGWMVDETLQVAACSPDEVNPKSPRNVPTRVGRQTLTLRRLLGLLFVIIGAFAGYIGHWVLPFGLAAYNLPMLILLIIGIISFSAGLVLLLSPSVSARTARIRRLYQVNASPANLYTQLDRALRNSTESEIKFEVTNQKCPTNIEAKFNCNQRQLVPTGFLAIQIESAGPNMSFIEWTLHFPTRVTRFRAQKMEEFFDQWLKQECAKPQPETLPAIP